MDSSENPYEILGGISENASEQEIRAAYRKLALKHHPDKQSNDNDRQQATIQFAKISNAYEILSDPDQRREYDQRRMGNAGGGYAHDYYGQQQYQSSPMDDFFNSHFQHHFHDPFQVFERVFREEFGHATPGNYRGSGGFGGPPPPPGANNGFPGGGIFDNDPFFSGGRGGFGAGFPGFGAGFGGGMMDDPFFSNPVGSSIRQQQQIQRHHQQQQQQYRDPFQSTFDSMRQMQQQQSMNGGGNGNGYTFTSTSTTTSYGPGGESVTTTTRNVNGNEVTERITTKSDGTVHRETLSSSSNQQQHQAIEDDRGGGGGGGRRDSSRRRDSNNNNNNFLPWGRKK